jgi:hypothetical protein
MKMEKDLLEVVRCDTLLLPVLFCMAVNQSKLGGHIYTDFNVT